MNNRCNTHFSVLPSQEWIDQCAGLTRIYAVLKCAKAFKQPEAHFSGLAGSKTRKGSKKNTVVLSFPLYAETRELPSKTVKGGIYFMNC
jgi:hypothetical protein